MKKLWLLLKIACRGMFHKQAEQRGGIRGRFGKAGYAVLMLLAWGMFAGYTVALGVGLNSLGMLRVYPVLVMAVDSLLMLVSVIARAPGSLFRSQDFDLVMSLPVPGHTVAAARLLELFAFEFLYVLAVLLPAGVTYAWFVRPGAAFYVIYFVSMLFVPVLPVILGAALGALAHVVSAAFKSSRLVSLAMTFIFMVAVMGASYSFGFIFEDYTPEQFMNLANLATGVFSRMFPPAALFGRAVTGPDWGAFALYAGASAAAFIALAFAFGRWFVPLNTLVNARHTRAAYRLGSQRSGSVASALLRREVKRYFASNIYVLNTAFGLVLSLIGVVALQFFDIGRLAVIMELTGFEDRLRMGVPYLVAFMVATCATTGCSISLEGRQLWLAMSLPVPARAYLMAKVKLNLLVSLPFALVDGALLAYSFRLTPLAAALALLLPVSLAVFMALFGLLCNLKWHRFDWTNETAIVKQSLAVFLPILANGILIGVSLALTLFTPALDYALVPLVTVAVVAVMDVGMYALIVRNAEKWVNRLREA